jgi:Ni/Co efflux regulator RcnB
MRKLIMMSLMAAVAIPSAGSAQSRGEIRHDRREVREERQDVRQARRTGDRQDVREERRELRGARQELREDRQDRRRSVRYVSPYSSWSYRPVSVGYSLRPAFYGSRYYVSDYNRFGARHPGRFQQWIRYGDDLLRVNTRNGRVLQVIRNSYYR